MARKPNIKLIGTAGGKNFDPLAFNPSQAERQANNIYLYAITATVFDVPKKCPLPVCRRNRVCIGSNRPHQILCERDLWRPFCLSVDEEAYQACKRARDAVRVEVMGS